MSDPYTEQSRVMASLSAENGLLRDEIERLRAELAVKARFEDDCEKLRTEIERLRALLRSEGANRYWEGRWRDAEAEIDRLTAALRSIGRRSAPSTRTWDGMLADMGWINDETRRVLGTIGERKSDHDQK